MFEKEKIRQELKEKRLLLAREQVEKWSSLISLKIQNILSKLKPKSLLFFYPIKNEPNLLPLASRLLKEGKVVAFPKIEGKEIVPIKVNSLKELQPGKFGIPEPPYRPQKVIKELDVIFVPGIAFDSEGYRVGFGGGFYDRLLEKLKVKAKIGVCFDFQLLRKLPREPFDIPVDIVITDKKTVRRKGWKQY